MDDKSKYKQSLYKILQQAISKNATLSPELINILEILKDHEQRINELETAMTDITKTMDRSMKKIINEINYLKNK